MTKCANCGVETSNPKFCSKSCAATVNNRGVRRHSIRPPEPPPPPPPPPPKYVIELPYSDFYFSRNEVAKKQGQSEVGTFLYHQFSRCTVELTIREMEILLADAEAVNLRRFCWASGINWEEKTIPRINEHEADRCAERLKEALLVFSDRPIEVRIHREDIKAILEYLPRTTGLYGDIVRAVNQGIRKYDLDIRTGKRWKTWDFEQETE